MSDLGVDRFGDVRGRSARGLQPSCLLRAGQQCGAQVRNQGGRQGVELELVRIVAAPSALAGSDAHDRQSEQSVHDPGFDVDGSDAAAWDGEQLLLEDPGAQLYVNGPDSVRGGEVPQQTEDDEQSDDAESPPVIPGLAAENNGDEQDREQLDHFVDGVNQKHASVEAEPGLLLFGCLGSCRFRLGGNVDRGRVAQLFLVHVASPTLVPAISVS
ncbi:hypothetical protein GCM10020255_096740 [Rhodococcus baikonurensis]